MLPSLPWKIYLMSIVLTNVSASSLILLSGFEKTNLVLGERLQISVRLNGNLTGPVLVKPNYEWKSPLLHCQHCEPQLLQWTTHSAWFEWTCEHPGAMTIFFTVQPTFVNSTAENVNLVDPRVDSKETFVQLQIGRSTFLHTLSWIFGWTYFVLWSFAIYPQIIRNFYRKSVIGLSFDFVALNVVGFGAYSVFNACFAWVSVFRESYQHLHPHSNIPVQINDVLLALHNFVVKAVLVIQCCIYERSDQRISYRVRALLNSTLSPAVVLTTMLICCQLKPLAYVYYFSYIKMLLTVTKYVPQVMFNYRQKSSDGLSIHTILMDFGGGVFSVGQMTCLAINFADFNYFRFNIAKVSIALMCLFFDIIFLVQHYWLYRDRRLLADEKASSSF